MQNSISEVPGPRSRLAAYAAMAWVALFFAGFFSLEFARDPTIVRWELWPLVPELVDFVAPLADGPIADFRSRAAHSGWQYFPQRLDLLAVAAIILVGAWGAGHLILRIVDPPLPARCLERTVFAFGLGFAALSLATLAAGLIGALSRPLLAALIALAFAVELVLRARRPPVPAGPIAAQCRLSTGHWLALAALAPFLLATLLGALLPSIDFDVNAYHFEGPREYFQAGRVSFLEHNVYTSFPFGTEMLTLLAMVLEGDWYRGALAGKCLLMFFGPLTGLALFAAGRRLLGTTAGVLAAVLYISTPWIYRISTIAYAEGGLCFYLFAALLAMMIEPSAGDRRATARQDMLAGLLAGAGMACKYPGLVSVVIPLLALSTLTALRRYRKAGWFMPGAFLLGTALTIGPWLAKNAFETGNPVYPLAYRLFGGRDLDAALDAKFRHGHSPGEYSLSSLVDLAVEVAARSKWDSPLLFAFAPLALACAPVRRRARWLWIYVGWLFLSCWLFTHRIDRFWVPMLPVVALLAGIGAAWWWNALRNGLVRDRLEARARQARGAWLAALADVCAGRAVVFLPLVAAGLFNLWLIADQRGLCGYNDYLRDLDEAGQFTAQFTAPPLVWMNQNLPPASKVLAVGDGAMFEARFPVVYNTVFDRSIFEEWLAARPGEHGSAAGLRDGAAIRKKLAGEGITHIYVNWQWVLRYRSPGNYGYTDFVTPARFTALQQMGILESALPTSHALMNVDDLDATWLPQLEAWGKSVIVETGARRNFVTYQVFPVARAAGDLSSAE